MGSNNLRGSNIMKEFDLDEDQKQSLHKFSPGGLNKSLPKDDAKQNLFDEVAVAQPGTLKYTDINFKQQKEKKLTQSLAEASIDRFKEPGIEEEIADEVEEGQGEAK